MVGVSDMLPTIVLGTASGLGGLLIALMTRRYPHPYGLTVFWAPVLSVLLGLGFLFLGNSIGFVVDGDSVGRALERAVAGTFMVSLGVSPICVISGGIFGVVIQWFIQNSRD
jgi:hypothetical protein